MKKKTKPKSTPAKIKAPPAKPNAKAELVMLAYGYDEEGKPRAGLFAEADFKLARQAASQLNLAVYVAKFDMIAPALMGIKAGQVHASGSEFIPNIQPKRFRELLNALKLEAPKPMPLFPQEKLAANWDHIKIGHVVIAQADDPSLGFWPTAVEAVDGEMLLLRSRDYPDITVTRHRYAVALPYTPAYSSPADLADAAPGLSKDFASLKPGHLVLGQQSATEGWWEALIAEVDDVSVVLRWRDFKTVPKFARSISQIALLCPQIPAQPAPAAADK